MNTSIFGTNAQFVAPIALYQDHCVSSLRLLCCNLHNLYKDNEHTMCRIASNTLPAAQLPPASISWCTLPRLVDRGSKQSSVQGFPGVTFHGASIIRFQDSDRSILAQKTLIRDGNSEHNGKKVKTPHNGVEHNEHAPFTNVSKKKWWTRKWYTVAQLIKTNSNFIEICDNMCLGSE